eukprot:snap_masked-scaffold_4-processed-gene-9.20-mRNA-1 protein AED:0.27 eAED:0.27 QI:0/-1/0/1/-1/1/1/0/354
MTDYATREGFLNLFDELIEILQGKINDKNPNGYNLPKDAVNHVENMMRYNVPLGKLNRGLTVVQSYKILCPEAAESEMKRAAVLGWCIEWIQAAFLVSDDYMDASITRRGQPCWYKKEEIGVIAINDALILLAQYDLLLQHFFPEPALFMKLHNLLLETVYQTEMGQNLDLSTQPPSRKPVKNSVDLSLYTQERYDLIVTYKTAFYSFYAPAALALILANNDSPKNMQKTKEIMMKMGHYFQVQDDYLDCFGDESVIGKIGTDIQDAKCGWLVCQALKIADEDQKSTIQEHYGVDEEESIQEIKKIYNKLNLVQVYANYEEKVYKELLKDIEETKSVPSGIFLGLLQKIYKRSK